MRCPRCTAESPPDARFCPRCGTALASPCPACGAANPAGFAYCGRCGAPLGRPASGPAEERKVVTVLFADVAGSTGLAERLDPEQTRALLGAFFEAMAQVIRRFGGTVEKFIGDEVMAVFGLPQAHEDDPERAVRAALAMQDRLTVLNREAAAPAGVALRMRVGINTGEVVANPAAAEKGEFLVTGDAVNVAARLRSAAEPETVLVGDRTYRLTAHVADYRAVPALALRGKSLPVGAWQLVAVSPEGAAPRPLRPTAPLVGREEELRLLEGLFRRVLREDRPHLVTILGLPGVGKSRLFEEMLARLPQEAAVRQGRSLPYGTTALWGLAEILRADCEILRTDPPATVAARLEQRVRTLFADGGAEAARVLREVGRVLAVEATAAAHGDDAGPEDLFWAVRRYVEQAARAAPLVVALDDLHWADGELLDLVEHLAEWATAPVLLVCLARPELLERRPGWGGGKRNATTLMLEPLSPEAAEHLVEALLGGEVPPTLRPALGRAEGNPFFLEELLRMWVDGGALRRRDGGWEVTAAATGVPLPDTVHSLVAARIDRLPAEEKQVLQDAAVLGRVFWSGALAHLTGLEEAMLGALLRDLQARDFLLPRSPSQLAGQEEFAFKHQLIQDVAYGMLTKARRLEKHRAAGTWLAGTYRDRAEEFSDLLAHHWGRAAALAVELGRQEEWQEVAAVGLRYALLAGQRAARLYAQPQAVAHFEAARDLAERLGREEERIAAVEGLADVLMLQGRWDEASRLYREALDHHLRRGDPVRQARMQSRIGSTFSGVFDFRQALPHIQSAMEALRGTESPADLAAVSVQMARAQTFLGNLGEAEAFARQGAELARRHGLREQEWDARVHLGWVGVVQGRPDALAAFEEILPALEQVLAAGGGLVEGGRAIGAWLTAAVHHFLHGEYGAGREALGRAERLAATMGYRSRLAQIAFTDGLWGFIHGAWDVARRALARYLELHQALSAWVEHARSLRAAMEGALDDALRWSREAVDRARGQRNIWNTGSALDWAVALHLDLGDTAGVRALLSNTLEELTERRVAWAASLQAQAAEAALGADDLEAAEVHLQRAEACRWMEIPMAEGRRLRAAGGLRARRGDHEGAVTLLEEALRIHRRAGHRLEEARTLEALAAAWRPVASAQAREAAVRAQAEAQGICEQLSPAFARSRADRRRSPPGVE